jgi:GT2 family glycosyltransferase
MMEARPLLTFGLFSSQQGKFVREALHGAFAQTYSPLEIIISDDCSTDDTFEIICDEAKKYAGPHRLKIRQNPRNLGFCSHINEVMAEAQGELFVVAAADDISLPHRVETIWREWERMGRKPSSLHSAFRIMDEEGGDYGEFAVESITCDDLVENCRRGLVINGCAHAWHKSVFQEFGPLREDLTYEDCAIALRSRLMGGVHFIPEPLIRYRRVEGQSSAPTFKGSQAARCRELILLNARRSLTLLQQWEDDFRTARNAPHGWEEMLQKARFERQFTIDMVQRSTLGRFASFLKYLSAGLPLKGLGKTYAMFASRLAFSLWVRLNPRMRESIWERIMNERRNLHAPAPK